MTKLARNVRGRATQQGRENEVRRVRQQEPRANCTDQLVRLLPCAGKQRGGVRKDETRVALSSPYCFRDLVLSIGMFVASTYLQE